MDVCLYVIYMYAKTNPVGNNVWYCHTRMTLRVLFILLSATGLPTTTITTITTTSTATTANISKEQEQKPAILLLLLLLLLPLMTAK